MLRGGRGAGFRSPLPRGSRGVDGPYDRDAGRAREDPPDTHWRSEAQRLAAEYFASQGGVTADQLGAQEADSRGDNIDALGGGVRGTANFHAYRGPERDKPKAYLDRGVIAGDSRGFEGLSRRAGGDDGRKGSLIRYNEPEFSYGDFMLSNSQAYPKASYDEYGREARFRDEAKEFDVFTGVSRHERELDSYSKEAYDPLRASRRARRREGMDYEGGRRYPEDEKGEDLYSVRGDSVLGKRKGKPYEGGSAKDYYSNKKPVYLTTMEAEQLRRSKGDVDLNLVEYDLKEFGRPKSDKLGSQEIGGLVEHGSRSLVDPASRKERLSKSETYDRRSALGESVSDRDSDRSFPSSRGRRGRRPPPRGSFSGDYNDGSDSRHGGSPRSHTRGPYLEERLAGKGDHRYPPTVFVRDPADGHRYKSHESAMDKGYEMELDRIQSPGGYEMGNGGSWRRGGDVGGRGHDMMEVGGRDKLAFLHQTENGPFLSPRNHGGPRFGYSKHRPDYHEREGSVLQTFRGGRRGRRGCRHGGISQADQLFHMHNMKAKKYAGEDSAELRYKRSSKRHHRSPSRSGDHRVSSKESDWEADAADGAVEKPDGDVTPLRDASPGANGTVDPSGFEEKSSCAVADSADVPGSASFLRQSTSSAPGPNPVNFNSNPVVPDINSTVFEVDDAVPETIPIVPQSNPSVPGVSPAITETESLLSNLTAAEPTLVVSESSVPVLQSTSALESSPVVPETISAVLKPDPAVLKPDPAVPEVNPLSELGSTIPEPASAVDESFLAFSQEDSPVLQSTSSVSASTSPVPESASVAPDFVRCGLESRPAVSEPTNALAESIAAVSPVNQIFPVFGVEMVDGKRLGAFHVDQPYLQSGAVTCGTNPMEVVKGEGAVISTVEEVSKVSDVVMASEGRPADEHPTEVPPADILSEKVDSSSEKTEAFKMQEDAAFQLYTQLFEESTDWRKMYEDQRLSGSFGCDVCVSSGIGVNYSNLAGLMEHTNSFLDSNKLADHRGYARAVSHFLELSSSPSEATELCSAEVKQEFNLSADAALTHQAKEDTETVASTAREDTQVQELMET